EEKDGSGGIAGKQQQIQAGVRLATKSGPDAPSAESYGCQTDEIGVDRAMLSVSCPGGAADEHDHQAGDVRPSRSHLPRLQPGVADARDSKLSEQQRSR